MAPIMIEIAAFSFLLATVWYVWFRYHRETCIEEARQRLFEIRDELFDFAAAGNIDFDNKAYGMLRLSLNGLIRFTHQIGLFRLLIIVFSYKVLGGDGDAVSFEEKLKGAILKLNSDQQEKVRSIQFQAHMIMASLLLRTSLVLSLTVRSFVWILRCLRIYLQIRDYFLKKFSESSTVRAIDAEAYNIASV